MLEGRRVSQIGSAAAILEKAVAGERLTPDEGLALLTTRLPLTALGQAADAVARRWHPEPFRTYNIDRNINYSNVCIARCAFCAFYRPPGHNEAYVLLLDVILEKIRETVQIGGNQVLLQGGLHPKLPLEWYEELLSEIRSHFPQVNVHGFSAPEIYHFSRVSKLPLRTVLERLKAAGLGSLPGGGAEILVDRVRQTISRGKVGADDWIAVHRTWHELGGRSTATMMFGHIETPAERIEHLERVRQLQDETGGFTAFICWTFQRQNTELAHLPPVGAFAYLKMLAVSRLYLDNVPNLQSSWVTQGEKIGQLALFFGANDMGSLMLEENVVAQAGTIHRLTLQALRRCIEDAGFIPRQRNVFYEYVDEFDESVCPGRAGRTDQVGWPVWRESNW
ncbi:MAG: dehypoxanthine futalosine cyclase [Planctomycetes bacterium]|nr:dehypoxanthine futalosine cyclase [Planctomycetota bacterium]